MLEKIKNWIIKVWNKHKDILEPEEYNLSHDRFAKLIFNDILCIMPPLMLTKYNAIFINYYNASSNRIYIQVFCNFFDNNENSEFQSEFQKERSSKEEYKWNLDIVIDKNNFGNSCQQLIVFRNILKSLTKEEPHYSQDEINKLMKKANELDKKKYQKKM